MCRPQLEQKSQKASLRPCSSRSSSRRTSNVSSASQPSSTVTGDSQQRVTVPMPRSLQELQNRAAQLFGKHGKLKLYHHGIGPITEAAQLGKVGHGDVVVVTWDDRKLTAGEFAKLISTSQADFVEHPLPAPREPTKLPPVVQSTHFEGNSLYKAEYVKHPFCKRDSVVKPSDGIKPSGGKTGKSTYEDQYPWHKVSAGVSRPPSIDAGRRKSEPFTAQTSYAMDFIKPPQRPRSTPAVARPRTARQHVPLEGVSSYQAEYKQHPLSKICRPHAQPTSVPKRAVPFDGTTEYQHEYLEKEALQSPMIHLEPEIGRSSSKGSSTQ